MNPLNNEQKELLFDYCMGLTSQKETDEAEALISSNQEAAEICYKVKAALEPLGSLEPESCPDELVENTISRVQHLVDSGQHQLQQLLATEQTKKVTFKIGPWRNWFEIAAVAAAILLFAGVLVPTLSMARQKYGQQRCKKQMSSIFQGLSNYISDYDDKAPAVASIAGAPWWKLGDQGRENQSNTRNIYLLPKGGYVELKSFVCPCCKKDNTRELTLSKIRANKDFPDRTFIKYSFQINCRQTKNGKLRCRKILMADMNPLFERLPEDFSKQFRLQLNKTLLTLNSANHNRRGQNVLFGDGRVEFIKKRFFGISRDDIYTLQDTDVYQGIEVPSCETDYFLAP